MRSGWPLGLCVALILYAVVALTSGRAVGVVGEVDIGWALSEPPKVLTQWAPQGTSEAGGNAGPLEARQTRPMESLVVGSTRLPLAINAYTGGAADWPARVARALTGERSAGVAVHLLLGGVLILLAHRFLRFHGTPTAAGAAALLLASDWVFVFFKRVLGGTEILLQAAGLLVVWALWSRRWKGGRHGTIALALGVGLGIGAKVTFVATLVAFGVAALLTRWDRPRVKPPERVNWVVLAGLPLICVSPLLLSWAHHHGLGEGPQVVSHDTLNLQLSRLRSGAHLDRESLENLWRFLGNSLGWLHDAWGTPYTAALSAPRVLTFAVAMAGAVLEWRTRTHSPSAALLRFLSLAVPLQVALLFLLNRDLHHLAQASVPLACLVALGADRVAGEVANQRSFLRPAVTALLIFPAVLVGVQQLSRTDAHVNAARAHTFTTNGQTALVDLLRTHHVSRLVVTDYELYGMLEQIVPEIEVTHGWGAVSRKDRSVEGLRAVAAGGHYLSVAASQPMIYNWRAVGVGVQVGVVSDGSSNWAELYRVD